jgi:CBS domain-containing protein
MVVNPMTIGPDAPLSEALALMKATASPAFPWSSIAVATAPALATWSAS